MPGAKAGHFMIDYDRLLAAAGTWSLPRSGRFLLPSCRVCGSMTTWR